MLTALFLLFQAPLLKLFGASADTLPYAMQYLNLYVLGTVFVMTSLGLNGFITAQGRSSVAMKTVVIGAVLNTVLDPLFIFVLKMGVRGAAVATIISQAVSAAWVLRFLTGKQTVLRLKRAYFRIDRPLLASAVGLGASPFVMQSTESLLTIAFNVSLQRYGGDAAVGRKDGQFPRKVAGAVGRIVSYRDFSLLARENRFTRISGCGATAGRSDLEDHFGVFPFVAARSGPTA